jgi:nucleotide-binding universal stress UspA family protein
MPTMYENLIIGVDGRPGGLDAAALAAMLATTTTRRHLVVVGASRRGGIPRRERHREAGAYGAR